MRGILFYDVNIFAILLLVSLIVIILLKEGRTKKSIDLFKLIIYMNIFMLMLEMASWYFDTQPGEVNYLLNWISNFLFTAMNMVLVGLWASYMDYLLFKDYKRLKKKLFYFGPTIVMIVISVINIFYPILFSINDDNVYERLPFIYVSLLMTIGIYIYMFMLIYKKRDEISGNVLFSVMIFLILPIIGAFIQLNSNIMAIWASTAVSVLFIYLLFETTSSAKDYLTGVYRRSRTEEYIETLLRKKRLCTVIMIDIDDFKALNDTYGHPIGDRVLVEFGKVLTRIFRYKAIVSRFGGDEFIVVLEGTHGDSIKFYKNEIKELLSRI